MESVYACCVLSVQPSEPPRWATTKFGILNSSATDDGPVGMTPTLDAAFSVSFSYTETRAGTSLPLWYHEHPGVAARATFAVKEHQAAGNCPEPMVGTEDVKPTRRADQEAVVDTVSLPSYRISPDPVHSMRALDMGPCDCEIKYVSSPITGTDTCQAVVLTSSSPSNTIMTPF